MSASVPVQSRMTCWMLAQLQLRPASPRAASLSGRRPLMRTACRCGYGSRAFSSEVDTGSREENASKQKDRAPFRFHRNGKGSRPLERLPLEEIRADIRLPLDRIVIAIDAVGDQCVARNDRVLVEFDRIQANDRGL